MSKQESNIIAARVGGKLTFYDGEKRVDLSINDPSSPSYIPEPRFDHCSSLIGNDLYIRGGECCSFDAPIVEKYDPHSERWTRQSTTGDIPKAKSGIACTHIGNKFYTFGGQIKTKCYTNVLSELDIATMIWTDLSSQDSPRAPRPKKDAAMISYKDYLIIFGGFGIGVKNRIFQFFTGSTNEEVWTNEVTLFDIKRSQWIEQQISGQPPEPCSECTLTYIGQDKAILLGGLRKYGKVGSGTIDSVKVLDLSNWNWISLPCRPCVNSHLPEYCYGHCTVSLHKVQENAHDPSVLLLWGLTDQAKYQENMWQLTLRPSEGLWKKIQFWNDNEVECPPAYKFVTDVVATKSGMQLVRFGGMIIDKKSPLGNTWILDLESNKNNEVKVVDCRVPRSEYTSVTGDSETANGNQSGKTYSLSEDHSASKNFDSNNDFNTSSKTWNLEKKKIDNTLNGECSSVFYESKDYPGLNFVNQLEAKNLEHSNKIQNINTEMGLLVTIPPEAMSPDENALTLSVAPAISGNIAAPPDCVPHSPFYIITPCNLANEVTVAVNHTCSIEDEEDCENMVVLVPVDLATSQKTGTYTLKEADIEKTFKKGSQTGEIKMKTLQPFRVAKKLSHLPDGEHPYSKKLYTLRVYKKDHHPCTPGDTIVFGISQLHPSYLKCLEDRIKQQYPKLKKVESFDALQFTNSCNEEVTLSIPSSKEINGWTINAMKKVITKDEIDLPDQMDTAGLDYPPTLTLFVINDEHHPSQNKIQCSLKVNGFNREIEVTITLELLQRRHVQSMSCCRRNEDNESNASVIVFDAPNLYSEETVLKERDLRVLYNALKQVSPHWRGFGLQLLIEDYVLENISSKSGLQGNDGYFTEMLSTWLKSSIGEAKTVMKLKEALNHISCQYIASELLARLNKDYKTKYENDIKKVISDFKSFLGPWQENEVIQMVKALAEHLDNLHRHLCISSDISHVAKEIYEKSKEIIDSTAVEKIIATNRAENESLRSSLITTSYKLYESLISETSATITNLPLIFTEIQNLTIVIEDLFVVAEAESMCVHYLTLEWKQKPPSHYPASI